MGVPYEVSRVGEKSKRIRVGIFHVHLRNPPKAKNMSGNVKVWQGMSRSKHRNAQNEPTGTFRHDSGEPGCPSPVFNSNCKYRKQTQWHDAAARRTSMNIPNEPNQTQQKPHSRFKNPQMPRFITHSRLRNEPNCSSPTRVPHIFASNDISIVQKSAEVIAMTDGELIQQFLRRPRRIRVRPARQASWPDGPGGGTAHGTGRCRRCRAGRVPSSVATCRPIARFTKISPAGSIKPRAGAPSTPTASASDNCKHTASAGVIAMNQQTQPHRPIH